MTREEGVQQCIGDLWSLSTMESLRNVHRVTRGEGVFARVTTPSCSYTIRKPVKTDPERSYVSGVILQFPAFHLEYVGTSPPSLRKHVETAGFRLKEMPA